jgi:hypothetical protein
VVGSAAGGDVTVVDVGVTTGCVVGVSATVGAGASVEAAGLGLGSRLALDMPGTASTAATAVIPAAATKDLTRI